jgi:hypothetical protein
VHKCSGEKCSPFSDRPQKQMARPRTAGCVESHVGKERRGHAVACAVDSGKLYSTRDLERLKFVAATEHINSLRMAASTTEVVWTPPTTKQRKLSKKQIEKDVVAVDSRVLTRSSLGKMRIHPPFSPGAPTLPAGPTHPFQIPPFPSTFFRPTAGQVLVR